MKILVINTGSSSLKYQLIDMSDGHVLAKGVCERIGTDGAVIGGKTGDGRSFSKQVPMHDHTQAFNEMKKALLDGDCKILDDFTEIAAVGHRIVHGGTLFTHSVLIDESVIEGIASFTDLAPLHAPANLQGIRASKKIFGDNIPMVAVFDSAFHSTMPAKAYMYAIPYEYYEKYGIRRYGFHGTSHKFVAHRCAEKMGVDISKLKIITCHIGNGSSITAVQNGKVLDTSMGMTPLDGFMMGTRCGTLDPSVVTFLERKENMTPDQIEAMLNKSSGVYGVSGISSDDRDICKSEDEGDERAALAHGMQAYQIVKYIGSYIAAMNGVDAIVFTGGIGENGRRLRENIMRSFSYLDIGFNNEVNEICTHGIEGEISTASSKIKVFVLATNEELMIAHETMELVNKLK